MRQGGTDVKKKIVWIMAAAMILGSALLLGGCRTGSSTGKEPVNTGKEEKDNTGKAENGETKEEENAYVLPEGTNITGSMPAFATQDLKGATYTQDIFAEKDITMVNVWGTFCGPCIAEMPSLEQLSKALPENAQIIGLLCDVSLTDQSNLPEGLRIVEDKGVTVPTLLEDKNLENFAMQFMFVPTTVFVDREGHILDDPVVGAVFENYVARFEGYLPGWKY